MQAVISKINKTLRSSDRGELLGLYEELRTTHREQLRKLIFDNNRIDLLATMILGYEVEPMHLKIMQFQFMHRETLQLCFRGAGKTTVGTVTKAIHLIGKNRDLRVALASKVKTNSEAFLKEIKGHLENNVKLIDLCGPFYDPNYTTKWDNTEIDVLGRKHVTKESSITCLGVESAVVSRHYDVILSDDLVDEDNSRTKLMRERVKTWAYQSLEPTLEPPDPAVPHRGEHHRLGTRYHWDDVYGHWLNNELKNATQIIPALDSADRSAWSKKFPKQFFVDKRDKMGTILFNAQYQCNTEAMKGEIFTYDDCQRLPDDEWPDEKKLHIFMGTDLAITEDEANDQFAIVVLGFKDLTDDSDVFVLDFLLEHCRFSKQTEYLLSFYKKWDPLRLGIEINQYQAAQAQTLEDRQPGIRLVQIMTDKDKTTRAWKLSPRFERKKVFFRPRGQGTLIDQFVMFPNYTLKDGFDAFDLADQARKRRVRKRRTRDKEPGLL